MVPKNRILFYCFLMFAIIIMGTDKALGYRPFVSTDASVAEPNKLQMELGFFRFLHDKKNSLDVPSLRASYGITKNWQVAAESDIQVYKEGKDRNFEIIAPAISTTTILREGILQGKEGPSFAAEFDVLLPSTSKGERNTGLSGVGIMSYKFSDVLFHINAGMELDRVNFKSKALWGIIMEYPFEGKLRIVSEINGTAQHDEPPQNFGLIGFIWSVGKADFDFGFRKGLSDSASDVELTSGVTFYF